MSFVQKIIGYVTNNGLEVDSNNRAKVNLAQVTDGSGLTGEPKQVGAVRMFSENDAGEITGEPYLYSPETDDDYRLRTVADFLFDRETLTYLAQNVKKHQQTASVMTANYSAAGLASNASLITTTGAAITWGTYATFPLSGNSNLYVEFSLSRNDAVPINTVYDIGFFNRGAVAPYAPVDGIYLRMTPAGLFLVMNSNGTETVISPESQPTIENLQKQTFILSITQGEVKLWLDSTLLCIADTPIGQSTPMMSSAASFSWRHGIVGGAAGAVFQVTLNSYNVVLSGNSMSDIASRIGNRVSGSYMGLSGQTLGSLANYANSANPAAAVPTNTSAPLGTGLGGQYWETDTLAVTTDGIIDSFQNPALTANAQAQRLVITGVKIESYVQTTLTGGGYVAQWSLAFGHTAVSLATADSANTKAPVRIALGAHSVAANSAALTKLATVEMTFSNPIYVNPGEFIAAVKKKVGTAPSAGVIAHVITFDYGWE